MKNRRNMNIIELNTWEQIQDYRYKNMVQRRNEKIVILIAKIFGFVLGILTIKYLIDLFLGN